MPEWRVYYDDGTTFDSAQGEPWQTRPFGVQVILQREPEVGRAVLHGWDFYVWDRSRRLWGGVDLQGLLDLLAHDIGCHLCAVRQGRTLFSHAEFQRALQSALADEDFAPKSATRTLESPRKKR